MPRPKAAVFARQGYLDRLLVILVFLLSPTTPRASAEEIPAFKSSPARSRSALLRRLKLLPFRFDKRVISGQFAGYGSEAHLGEIVEVVQKHGVWPKMIGFDCHDYAKNTVDWTANTSLIYHWRKGGWVTVSNHSNNPATGENVYDRKIDITDLLTPGTTPYLNWRKELDAVAEGLRELQDHGVIVLWRPFHEMNTPVFWWGGRSAKHFISLWRDMHEYFTRVKGLENLLWVYSPDQNWPFTVKTYYPGGDVVDIVALDVYMTNPHNLWQRTYHQLIALGKPFGLGEYGPGSKNGQVQSADFSQLIRAIREKFPRIVFFQAWHGPWGLHDERHLNAGALLKDPWVITR